MGGLGDLGARARACSLVEDCGLGERDREERECARTCDDAVTETYTTGERGVPSPRDKEEPAATQARGKMTQGDAH